MQPSVPTKPHPATLDLPTVQILDRGRRLGRDGIFVAIVVEEFLSAQADRYSPVISLFEMIQVGPDVVAALGHVTTNQILLKGAVGEAIGLGLAIGHSPI